MEKELNIIWMGKLFIKEISLMKKEKEKANIIIWILIRIQLFKNLKFLLKICLK